MGSVESTEKIDVLLVGAGFGSFALWKKLKELNLNLTVKIYEKAPSSGGVWYWNCYPGARVDSDIPAYQLFDQDLYTTFNFTERYPNGAQLLEYFRHVENTWNITPDIEYNKCVNAAVWDSEGHFWKVGCEDGSVTYCKWLVPCLGLASKRYMPPFEGLENFKGKVYHTAVWPQDGVDLKGKKVAVVGTGASGVQVIQEIGEEVEHLTVYQRTPNLCLPMNQGKLDLKEEEWKKKEGKYEDAFDTCRKSFAGFAFDMVQRSASDDTPQEREKLFQSLWDYGGFSFWVGSYKEIFYNQELNDEVYKFWRSQVLKRITNPRKAELLAPEKARHPWGTKRPSLEQRFYEVIDQDHVDIIDINTSPIVSITPTGIVTKEEGLVPLDIIILATGFDVSASISALNLVGLNNETISAHWSNGLKTSMGISVPGFPNMLYIYGPHAPTAFANGPTATQLQAEWVAETIGMAEREGITWFEAKVEMEEAWGRELTMEWEKSLFTKARGWYNAANIPGRKIEGLFWLGGMPRYMEWLKKSNENGYQGWILKKQDAERRNSE